MIWLFRSSLVKPVFGNKDLTSSPSSSSTANPFPVNRSFSAFARVVLPDPESPVNQRTNEADFSDEDLNLRFLMIKIADETAAALINPVIAEATILPIKKYADAVTITDGKIIRNAIAELEKLFVILKYISFNCD